MKMRAILHIWVFKSFERTSTDNRIFIHTLIYYHWTKQTAQFSKAELRYPKDQDVWQCSQWTVCSGPMRSFLSWTSKVFISCFKVQSSFDVGPTCCKRSSGFLPFNPIALRFSYYFQQFFVSSDKHHLGLQNISSSNLGIRGPSCGPF